MRNDLFAIAVILLLSCGCAAPVEEPAPRIDLEAAQSSLKEADRAWAEAYAASDDPADAFVSMLADDAYLLAPDAPLARGKEAIRSIIADLEARPGFSVSWEATAADVGSAGDIGYTIGTYRMEMTNPDGEPIRIDGKYLTVWKKQPDGNWRVVADMFNPDGPPSTVNE